MDLIPIFFTGLFAGGLTCLAVQGGLLASIIAAREKEELDDKLKKPNVVIPTISFLIAKLVAYTIFGFLLGTLGSAISLTQSVQSFMQLLAGIYMIIIALNLLDVHPIFRYFVIQPPRFITKFVRSRSKSADMFAPAFLGVLTLLIPCGTTIAMEGLAISSASGLKGAAILGAFVLGTFPMFLGIGVVTAKLGETMRYKFLKIAAVILILLGFSSLYGSLVAMGAPISINRIESVFTTNDVPRMSTFTPKIVNGYQNVSIQVSSRGYNPSIINLKEGIPIKLSLQTNNTYSCAIAFRIPALGVGINLKATGTEVLTLPPLRKGNYLYTCSMGMYQGTFRVI